MYLLRRICSRLSEDFLLLALLLALPPLYFVADLSSGELPGLVDWHTIAALAGLIVLSRGLEESGYLAQCGRWLLSRVRGERTLALFLVGFSAALSAVVTNDVALFIVVPLTLGLRVVSELPVGRLIVFEALAVNAGSAISPIGNPQNLFLWQASGVGFFEFVSVMAPLSLVLMLILVLAVPLAFSRKPIRVAGDFESPVLNKRLLWLSLLSYLPFLLLVETGWGPYAALAVLVLYAGLYRRVVLGVDWLLLLIFVLMFVDLGLLASLPAFQLLGSHIEQWPGGMFTAGVLFSQLISNVPAAIFLEGLADDWQRLAWGVSVGGFGLAIGSLANLIALRLARQRGLWREFHWWSVPVLIVSCVAVACLLR
ncbi:transporter [Alkalilimnicola ehrlichii]|uniref:Transporter n=1 Tax=Alkalilimnicola ehrlichii TaxID=351052 RepID=A0A3E0WNY5_9GAMM|nr:SLC13 family permease [Alkalilimnicola ehrlichii]RFA26819.1 transporter [Alkalilimnicola ehrlichii]RFA33913.1 transporter [Alkalilimnicola ehrlichii]